MTKAKKPAEAAQTVSDPVARYERQVAMVDALRAEWANLGRPMTAEGGATGRATVVHPLVVAIQDAEMRADRLFRSTLERRRPGKPVGSTSAPDRAAGAPPRLKVVGQ